MSWKEEKRQRRRREDNAVTALVWAIIVGVIGSVGAFWYMVIRFMNELSTLTEYFKVW